MQSKKFNILYIFFPPDLEFFSLPHLREHECKSHPFRFSALTIEVVMAFTWQFGTQSTLSRAMTCKRHASCLCISLQSARPSQTCICFLFGLLYHQIRILTAGPSKKSLSSAKNAPNLHKHSWAQSERWNGVQTKPQKSETWRNMSANAQTQRSPWSWWDWILHWENELLK